MKFQLFNRFFFKRLIIIVLTITFFSCKKKEEHNNRRDQIKLHPKGVIIDVSLIEEGNIRQMIDKIDFIPLETSIKSLFSEINKVVLHNDLFYIHDLKFNSLKVFTITGEYVKDIGGIGRGPGEFSTLFDFDINPNKKQLSLLSNNDESVFIYDLKGNYIETKKTGLFASLHVNLGNKNYYYINHNKNSISKEYNLIEMGENSRKVNRRLFKFNKDLTVMHSEMGILKKRGDEVLFSPALSDTIFQIDKNGKIFSKFIFDFGNNKLKDFERQSEKEFSEVAFSRAYLQKGFFDLEDIIIFDYIDNSVIKHAYCKKGTDNVTDNVINKQKTLLPKEFILPFCFGKLVGQTSDNRLITTIIPQTVKWYIEENPKYKDILKKDYPKLFNTLSKTDHADNPILVTIKFKS